MFPRPLKRYDSVYSCYWTNGGKYRTVARAFFNLPSYVRRTMEFIRPMVEERFTKMEEFGDTWNDAPVRRPVSQGIIVAHAMGDTG